MASNALETLSLSCTVKVPNPDDSVSAFLDRWSNTYCSLPAALIIPETEADIVGSLQYANNNGLQVVVMGGKHGAFVPITSKTLCLDLSKFNAFTIDEEASTVSIGAATLTGDLLRGLAARGYYTCLPNSNKVGVVGCFIGGGSGSVNSLHGFLADQAVAIRMIDASGEMVVLDSSSSGGKLDLFKTLQGAGHGLGVIVELVMKIFPISSLSMTDNKIWTRQLIFSPNAIDVAATIFERLQPVKGPMQCSMLFSRALPMADTPGGPMIVLIVMYFGPSVQAEEALKHILTPDICSQAKINATVFTKFEDTNNATEAGNAHGGYKRPETIFVPPLSAVNVTALFKTYTQLGESCPDAARSICVLAAYNTAASREIEKRSASETMLSKFRDRGAFLYLNGQYAEKDSQVPMEGFLKEMRRISHNPSATENEVEVCRLPANFTNPAVMSESYSDQVLNGIKRVKKHWDPSSLFWSPVEGSLDTN